MGSQSIWSISIKRNGYSMWNSLQPELLGWINSGFGRIAATVSDQHMCDFKEISIGKNQKQRGLKITKRISRVRSEKMVVGISTPLKKIRGRHLGWWHSQLIWKNKSHVPVTTNQVLKPSHDYRPYQSKFWCPQRRVGTCSRPSADHVGIWTSQVPGPVSSRPDMGCFIEAANNTHTQKHTFTVFLYTSIYWLRYTVWGIYIYMYIKKYTYIYIYMYKCICIWMYTHKSA